MVARFARIYCVPSQQSFALGNTDPCVEVDL